MSYANQLKPWGVYRVDTPNLLLNRFKKRTDAEAYAKLLKQGSTPFKFEIVFDGTNNNDN